MKKGGEKRSYAVFGLGEFGRSVAYELIAAGVPFILAKSQNSIQTSIFERIGADKIVTPEHDGGIRVARNIIAGNFIDFFELSKNVRMVEVTVKSDWIGKI